MERISGKLSRSYFLVFRRRRFYTAIAEHTLPQHFQTSRWLLELLPTTITNARSGNGVLNIVNILLTLGLYYLERSSSPLLGVEPAHHDSKPLSFTSSSRQGTCF
ncbi:hypothetical protein EVAR_22815_1 [Eumeta japonica]|uniref:Uncharacterized protein n=1 Tax=Eumeta variegata TaxID=151549 RepID=A0A4C1VHD7_EUMVA|nr:hypothetical protein EVAR_22815_1 [Eumeta japonica]